MKGRLTGQIFVAQLVQFQPRHWCLQRGMLGRAFLRSTPAWFSRARLEHFKSCKNIEIQLGRRLQEKCARGPP